MSIARPASPQECAAALAGASAAGEAVDVVGGGTRSRIGRPGPAAPRRLETAGMGAVVAHEPTDLTLTVEAGMTVTDAAEIAASGGQCWPQAEVREGSTIGGVLATAASSRERLRSGAVRDSVLQLVVATGDGRLVTAGGRTVKGVSGFDIPRLAVGSLGTLGVIVQVTLKLWPIPPARAWFGAEGGLEDRLAAAGRLVGGGLRPACVLLLPGRVAVELAGPADDVVPPDGFAPLDAAPLAPAGAGTVQAGVSPALLGTLCDHLESAGLDYEARMGVGTCVVGVGSAEEVGRVRAWAAELGGHAVVTDGDDALRADPFGAPPPGIHIMRRLRDAFDPAGILNRRQLLWA